MKNKQWAVRFVVKHEMRCQVALHSSTELTISRIAQDNQKVLVKSSLHLLEYICLVSLGSVSKCSMDPCFCTPSSRQQWSKLDVACFSVLLQQ